MATIIAVPRMKFEPSVENKSGLLRAGEGNVKDEMQRGLKTLGAGLLKGD